MALTNLTIINTTWGGVDVPLVDADETNGNKFLNNGATRLRLKNTSGTDPATVTIKSPKTVSGLAVADQVITLAFGDERFCKPFDPDIFNIQSGADVGYVEVEITGTAAASVQIAAFI